MNCVPHPTFLFIYAKAELPGFFIELSEKGGGRCGLHAATKIIRRITRAPKAMPRITAFDIAAVRGKK